MYSQSMMQGVVTIAMSMWRSVTSAASQGECHELVTFHVVSMRLCWARLG